MTRKHRNIYNNQCIYIYIYTYTYIYIHVVCIIYMWYVLYVYNIYYVCIWRPSQKNNRTKLGYLQCCIGCLGPPRGVGRKNCLTPALCGESELRQYVSGKTVFEVFTTPEMFPRTLLEMFRNYSITESKKLTNWKLTSLWRTWASTICLWER